MELGERIRQARLEKGLSQRQLCGDRLTRNMLSLIENGSARPSMDTLQYFAQRLEKPVGWFLEEQLPTDPDQELLQAARAHFLAGEYRQVTQTLAEYQGKTYPEVTLLEALSFMEQARQAIGQEKLAYARSLLEKASYAGGQTGYFTPACQREWVLLMAQADPDDAVKWEQALETDSREQMLRARAALAGGDYDRCARILDAGKTADALWHYLRGQAAMGQQDYELARTYLSAAEEGFPQLCAQALESCYRELGDYKMAYHYACKLRQL